jgi:methyl-accepting chemotaxis protein
MSISSFLNNIKIGHKIYGGFAIVLAVLVTIGGMSVFMNSSNKASFMDYRVRGRPDQRWLPVSTPTCSRRVLSFMNYRSDQSPEISQELHDRLDAALAAIKTMEEVAHQDEVKTAIAGFSAQVETYREGFNSVSELQGRSNEVVNGTLDQTRSAIAGRHRENHQGPAEASSRQVLHSSSGRVQFGVASMRAVGQQVPPLQ